MRLSLLSFRLSIFTADVKKTLQPANSLTFSSELYPSNESFKISAPKYSEPDIKKGTGFPSISMKTDSIWGIFSVKIFSNLTATAPS